MNSPAISIVKWAQSQFPAILPGGVIDSKPLMKAGSNKTTTKYEAMKEQLLQEAKTHQSEWSDAENGSLN
jgi:nitrous oxide maturation protein nosD